MRSAPAATPSSSRSKSSSPKKGDSRPLSSTTIALACWRLIGVGPPVSVPNCEAPRPAACASYSYKRPPRYSERSSRSVWQVAGPPRPHSHHISPRALWMPRHDAIVVGEFELPKRGDVVSRRAQRRERVFNRRSRRASFNPDDRAIVETGIPLADAYLALDRRERPRWSGVLQGFH